MIVAGRNPVLEALRGERPVRKCYVRYGAHGPAVEAIRREARARGVSVVVLPKEKFARLARGTETQGVAALLEDAPTLPLEALLDSAREQDPPFFVALDGITDPHNAGAVLRSAECAGAHGAILSARHSAPLTATVVKAAAGATTHLPIAVVPDLRDALEIMRGRGVRVCGLASDGDLDLFAFDGAGPLCLVVGSEGHGLRPAVRGACDVLVRIPMWGRVASLNASVAAALALYEVRRRRI